MASNPEGINFLDLACMFKIEKDTTIERFGTTINASVFDAAHVTGELKMRGLVDFTAYYPGPNSMVITDAGKQLMTDAETKSAEPLDALDDEILRQMSGGKRFPTELQSTLNVRSKDLAFRLYKLYKQNFLGYELRNGNVELTLTEQGFLRAKPVQVVQPPKPQTQPQAQPVMQPQQQQAQPQAQATVAGAGPAQEQIKLHGKPRKRLWIGIAIAIVILAAVYYVYTYMPGLLSSI